MMRDWLTDGAAVKRALRAPARRFEMLFTLGLLVLVGTFLVVTFEYSGMAKLIPLLVIVPTFALLWVILLAQTSDQFDALVRRYANDGVLDVSDRFADSADEDDASQTTAERRAELLGISAWILALTLVFHYVGIKVALAAFLLGYYRFRADQSLPRAIGYSVGVWVFIYLVFEVMLGTTL